MKNFFVVLTVSLFKAFYYIFQLILKPIRSQEDLYFLRVTFFCEHIEQINIAIYPFLTSVPWLALPESWAASAMVPSPVALPLSPSCGLVASNNTLSEAIACSWVAFSSTLPENIKNI